MRVTAPLLIVLILAAGPAGAVGEFVGMPTGQEIAWIRRHQDVLRARLKDGESAQFRNLYVSKSGGSPIVCGEVNAKNGFGAYGGFERWFGAEPVGVFVESDVEGFGQVWAKYCAR